MLSAIQVQGFQAIEDGVVTRIVPFNQAFNFAGGAGNNKLMTKVIKIEHVQVATLVPVLKPVMSSGARLKCLCPEQLHGGHRCAVQYSCCLESLIAELDDASLSAVEVISLEYISAGEAVYIAGQLKQLKKQELSLVEDGMNNRVIVSGPASARRGI